MDFDGRFTALSLIADYRQLLRSKHDFVRDHSHLPAGADRLDRRLFERQLRQHLRAIERKVTQGRWTFSPFLEREVEKTGGGTRTISLSTIRDTLVQRGLYDYLYDIIDTRLSHACTGYRKGIGAHDAVGQIRTAMQAGRTHVLDADIQKFFDNLDHSVLRGLVRSLPIDCRAEDLLDRYVATPRVSAEDRRNADAGCRSRYATTARTQGLPQGGVLSGMLANLYLADFDSKMSSDLGTLVRYADDFVVCCHSEADAERAKSRAATLLSQIGLRLHPNKTDVRGPSEAVEFVGFSITSKSVRARSANVAKFRERIREVLDDHDLRRDPAADLRYLAKRLAFKIEGPVEHVQRLIANGLAKHPYRRCWIGYFRIINEFGQVKDLDRWIRAQVSRYMWTTHHKKTTASEMRVAGLPTLFRTMWKARAPAAR